MIRHTLKAFLVVAALAGTLGTAARAEANVLISGYVCLIQTSVNQTTVTVYSGSGCTGSYQGFGYLFAPGYPTTGPANYWTQPRFETTTDGLINNRWSHLALEVNQQVSYSVASIVYYQN